MLQAAPISPLADFSAEDEGWDNIEDASIGAAEPTPRVVEDDDLVSAGDNVEAQVPRSVPAPNEPSADQIAKHNLTHYPYRSWCPHCLASRRPNAHQPLGLWQKCSALLCGLLFC